MQYSTLYNYGTFLQSLYIFNSNGTLQKRRCNLFAHAQVSPPADFACGKGFCCMFYDNNGLDIRSISQNITESFAGRSNCLISD